MSAIGYPLTQRVIRHGGRRGAVAAEGVCTALFARDTAMILAGTPGVLRAGPATLLWLETAAAAVAVVSGLPLVLDEGGWRRALAARPAGAELVRRSAVGVLFAIHTARFWIYLQPDQGKRPTR